MRFLLVGLALVFSLSYGKPGRADVLYQSIPDLTVGAYNLGVCSPCSGSGQVYDEFTLSAASTISEVDFAVSSFGFNQQPITVGIYNVAGGLPGTQILSQTFSGYTISTTTHLTKIIDVFPSSWSLAAGIYDITFSSANGLQLSDYNVAGQALYQSGSAFSAVYPTGFDIIGSAVAVPEPASLTLFSLALIGLAGVRQRRAAQCFASRRSTRLR
nr:PEP-CTERM sorting domain-containing protein [uncultured Rhodopila sp.]